MGDEASCFLEDCRHCAGRGFFISKGNLVARMMRKKSKEMNENAEVQIYLESGTPQIKARS